MSRSPLERDSEPSEVYDAPDWVIVEISATVLCCGLWLLGLLISVVTSFTLGSPWVFCAAIGILIPTSLNFLLVDRAIRGLWLRYYESQGIFRENLPSHNTFPSWVGLIEIIIFWSAATSGRLEISAAWLTFKVAINLTRERSDAVGGQALRDLVSSGRKRVTYDPVLAQLMLRAPVNILVFGVGLNLVLATSFGLWSRLSLWQLSCGHERTAPVVIVRELASPMSTWTCGATPATE